MEDKDIIDLFFERSEQAIVELSYKYEGICRKVSFNILHDLEDVEECVNDTYWGVWNSIPPKTPNPLITYVCRITRNLSLKKFRYNTAKKRNSFFEISLSELGECIPVNCEDEYKESHESLVIVIEKFLDSLNQENRVIFIKRYWFSENISDIAKEFNVKENTVVVKLARIRKKLKKYLEQEGIIL